MAGDALGAPAEFLDRDEILAFYPHGLQSMVDGFGIVRDRLAGEVTDDSQMAACLQRALERADGYNPAIARDEYLKWLATDPPDVGETVQSTLMGIPKPESQGNGALMRVFPIALWTLEHPEFDWKSAAMDDAAITHTNFTCHLANLVFVSALHYALAVNYGQVNEHRVPVSPSNVLQSAITACEEFNPKPEAQAIIHVLREARIHPPEYDGESIGWVLVTLQGAFYQLLHAPSLRSAITRAASAGGDTDTNAAVTAVLYAATFPNSRIPTSWLRTIRRANPDYAKYLPTYPEP